MNLQDILKDIEFEILNIGFDNNKTDKSNVKCQICDINIDGIAFDSRKVKDNYLFVAEKGDVTDGHLYIN